MIWKILIMSYCVVLGVMYLNERWWRKFFQDDRDWWQKQSDEWHEQATECLDLAKKYFYKGMVQHKETGVLLRVYGAVMVSMADLQTYLLVFVGGKWLWIREDEVEPASIPEATGKPTEGPTYVHFEGKTYQTDETITATI